MIVKGWQSLFAIIIKHWFVRKVYLIICKLLNDAAQTLCFCQVIHHLTQMKLVDDVLHVLAESIQVVDEVHLQAQRVGFAFQRLHGELRGIVERIASDIVENGVLVLDMVVVEHLFLLQELVFGRLQQHVDTTQHHHRHYDLLIFAFLEGIN